MLTSLKTEDATVEPMLRVLSTLHTDEGAYIRCVVEIINDVKDPLDDGTGSRSATLEKLQELRSSLVRAPRGGDDGSIAADSATNGRVV